MGLSINTYTFSGGSQVFPINFALGYTNKNDVRVQVNNEAIGSQPVYREFTWIDDSNIEVTGLLNTGDTVEISRTVSKDELDVNFTSSDNITKENLDRQSLQAIHLVHELLDGRLVVNANLIADVSAALETIQSSLIATEVAAERAELAAVLTEGTLVLPTVSALRTNTHNGVIILQGTDTPGDIGAGTFISDFSTGHTSAEEDGGVTFVDDLGRLWTRQFTGAVNLGWYSVPGKGAPAPERTVLKESGKLIFSFSSAEAAVEEAIDRGDATQYFEKAVAATNVFGNGSIVVPAGVYAVKFARITEGITIKFEKGSVITPFDLVTVSNSNSLFNLNDNVTLDGLVSLGLPAQQDSVFQSIGAIDAVRADGRSVLPYYHVRGETNARNITIKNWYSQNGGLAFGGADQYALTIENHISYNTVVYPLALFNGIKRLRCRNIQYERIWNSEAFKIGSENGEVENDGRNFDIHVDKFDFRDWSYKSTGIAQDGIDLFNDAGSIYRFTNGYLKGPGGFEVKCAANDALNEEEARFQDILLSDIQIDVTAPNTGSQTVGLSFHQASSGIIRFEDQCREVMIRDVHCRYVGGGVSGGSGIWIGLWHDVTLENVTSSGWETGMDVGERLTDLLGTVHSTTVNTTNLMVNNTGDGTTTSFAMSYMVPDADMLLDVNGSHVTTGFTIDHDTARIEFATAPTSGHTIKLYQIARVTTNTTKNLKLVNCTLEGSNEGISITGATSPYETVVEIFADAYTVIRGEHDGIASLNGGVLTGSFDGTLIEYTDGAVEGGHSAIDADVLRDVTFRRCRLVGKAYYAIFLDNQNTLSDSNVLWLDCEFDIRNGSHSAQTFRTNRPSGHKIIGGICHGNVDNTTYGATRLDGSGAVEVIGLKRAESRATTPAANIGGHKGEEIPSSADGDIKYVCVTSGTASTAVWKTL